MNFQQKLQNSIRKKSELEKEIEQAETSIKSYIDSKEYGLIHRKLDLIMANLSHLEQTEADIIYYREQADLELSQGSY